MDSRELGWGIIGLGFFGEVHADALSGMPGIRLAAMCTRRRERLTELALRYDVPGQYTDFQELLADPAVEVVSITTHLNDHRDIAVAALMAGKHVLLEKPMAGNAADCDAIMAAAKRAAGLLMVGHICRFDPRVALAKQAIDEGRIGRIISMHARRNLSQVVGRAHLDKISALVGDGIHDADLMLWFSRGRATSVYAQEVHPGHCRHPDGGFALIRFDTDAVGVVESVWHLPENTPYAIDARMEVIGTEGAVYINCAEAGLTIHDTTGVHEPDTVYWPRVLGERLGVLQTELGYFAKCVRAGRPPDRITPEESRAAVALIAAADQSAKSGQVVTLARGEEFCAVR